MEYRGKTAKKNNEYYTPYCAWKLIQPYIAPDSVIWECAYGTGLLAQHMRQDGYPVVGESGLDFLSNNLDCDVIVSNPPFSLTAEFLHHAYEIGKPFAFLLPIEKLVPNKYHSQFRANGIQLLIPQKRISFINTEGLIKPIPFPTIWYCWKLLPNDLVFTVMP